MTDLPDPPADDSTVPAHGDRGRDARVLDAEERALAALIASSEPQGQPSAQLDARVLAMARAPASAVPITLAAADPSSASSGGASAGAAPATRAARGMPARSHHRRRWPSMLGIAATLTLTFGLAWQMRPQDAAPIEASDAMRAPPAKTPGASGPRMDEAAESAMASTPPAPRDITRDNGAAAGVVAEPAQSAGSLAANADTSSQRAETAQAAASASAAVEGIAPAPAAPVSEPLSAPMAPAPAPPSAPTVFDDPSPLDTPAPAAPPPPPAPSAARTAAKSKAEVVPVERSREAEAKQRRTSNAADEADAAAATSSDRRTELDRIEVTGSRINGDSDQPLDDQPPASADSPAVREAWLARVRQLIADGRTDFARDSLREYRRRYPDAPIPDDLRPLLPAE